MHEKEAADSEWRVGAAQSGTSRSFWEEVIPGLSLYKNENMFFSLLSEAMYLL